MAAKAAEGHRGKRKKPKQRKRIEEAVQYALSHRIRIEILTLLNEGSYTAGEVAEVTDIELSNVSNHIKRMLEDGSIEVAKVEERRATNVYWYRAVDIPEYSQEKPNDRLSWSGNTSPGGSSSRGRQRSCLPSGKATSRTPGPSSPGIGTTWTRGAGRSWR